MACALSYPEIPDEFASYAEAIKSTMKQSIKFKLSANSKLKKWQSKVGGIPYLPLEEQYPVSAEGEKLLFLAQVNFAELPHVEGLPKQGIVEFFIDGNDDLMGLQDNEFKVLYFRDVIEENSKLHDNLCENITFDAGPFERSASYSMSFTVENQYISIWDHRFKSIADFGNDWEMYDNYALKFPANGHRIGGYPFFTQSDPRPESGENGYELLFQLDSDLDILWGDMGVGAFFIKPNDLKELNFTDILYNWDCT